MSSPDASDWLNDPPPNHELSQIAFTENERGEELVVPKKDYGARRMLRTDEVRLAEAAVDLGDLIEGGHRFSVESFSRAAELPTTCRYCGGPLELPVFDAPCEFGERPWSKCRCNVCYSKAHGLYRRRGGQPKVCKATECQRLKERDQQRRYRARKKAEALAPAAA
ncbi:hypothetical protein [Rhodococcus sp. 05-2254-6]|uniref:hypothetical protein n=1 Tax=Rhodococcus sp. 05-2254-6 TaxID=2022489 RepID=UPI00117BD89E|nr:hypothetical protein [Rhodococcus sp. 05-2254-6]